MPYQRRPDDESCCWLSLEAYGDNRRDKTRAYPIWSEHKVAATEARTTRATSANDALMTDRGKPNRISTNWRCVTIHCGFFDCVQIITCLDERSSHWSAQKVMRSVLADQFYRDAGLGR